VKLITVVTELIIAPVGTTAAVAAATTTAVEAAITAAVAIAIGGTVIGTASITTGVIITRATVRSSDGLRFRFRFRAIRSNGSERVMVLVEQCRHSIVVVPSVGPAISHRHCHRGRLVEVLPLLMGMQRLLIVRFWRHSFSLRTPWEFLPKTSLTLIEFRKQPWVTRPSLNYRWRILIRSGPKVVPAHQRYNKKAADFDLVRSL
jgi:hypothetical protein